MKKLLLSTIVLLSVSLAVQSQCNTFFDLKKDYKWEMTSYSPKDKVISIAKNKVINYSEVGGGFEASMQTTIFDKKGKQEAQTEYKVSCKNNEVFFDMQQLVAGNMESIKDMKLKINGDNITYPASLSVGDQLPPGKITMEMEGEMSSAMQMNFFIEILDRKVVAKEKITTPAGTFDCYKITYRVLTKVMFNIEVKAEEWIAEGRGVVKTASYSKKGKLTGYSLLTKVN